MNTIRAKSIFALLSVAAALLVGIGYPVATHAGEPAGHRDRHGHGHYAAVHGLRMYYEVHGQRRGQPPLVLLHGGFSSIGVSFGDLLPTLARKRQVIAIEQQGHGHTADIDRPLRVVLMAEDTVELLHQIGVQQADIFGYSMGAAIALNIGVRHPRLVHKLVLASTAFDLPRGLIPGYLDSIPQIRPENFIGTKWYEEYLRIAPRPQDFPILVEKIKDLNLHGFPSYPASDIRAMRAPTLVVVGDEDIVLPEHAVEMFRLLGGGVLGSTLPDSELAILPATTHVGMENNATLLLPIVPAFLDRPIPS